MEEHNIGGGITIRSYDVGEDIFADMKRAEDEANARITPTQAAITFGDCVVNASFMAYLNDPKGPPPIWGIVESPEEVKAWHLNYYADRPEDVQEDGFTSVEEAAESAAQDIRDQRERGYVQAPNWYSLDFPNGEDAHRGTHITQLVPVSREDYEWARDNGWMFSIDSWNRFEATYRQIGAELREMGKL